MRMSLTTDGKDRLDQRLFALTHIEGRHTCYLQIAIDQHNGTTSLFTEIGCMFEIEAGCHEIVDELPLIGCLQFVERNEDVHLSHRNQVGEQGLQTEGSQAKPDLLR